MQKTDMWCHQEIAYPEKNELKVKKSQKFEMWFSMFPKVYIK